MAGITHQRVRLDRGWLNGMTLVAFLVGIIFTGLVVNSAYQALQAQRLAKFDNQGTDLIEELEKSISDQQYLMLGVRSLFDGSADVSRLDFKRYLDSIDIVNSFPSAFGVGWFLRVPHHMLEDFERIVREDRSVDSRGYPDFKVFPESEVAEHHVITFQYPDFGSHALFGFDVGSDSERLLTLEQARDSGDFAATKPLEMLEGEVSGQAVLLMLPVYSISNPKNLQQRRQSYIGMLSGVFRIDVLMAGTDQDDFTSVAIRDVTDERIDELAVPDSSARAPFHSSGELNDSYTSLYKTMKVGGREWEIQISMSPAALQALQGNTLCWVIGLLGSLFSVLACLAIGSLTAARDRALRQGNSLEAALQQANNDLQRSSGDLSQFASIAAHDLQVPVHKVDTSVTLLEDALSKNLDPHVREYLDDLRSSTSRMRKLGEDLLEFSLVDRENLQPADLDLNDIAANVERKLAELIEGSDATITLGELPIVRGDQDQLEMLFVNLFSNAIKFRDPGRSPQIGMDACLVGSDWEVRISDNGIGIDRRFYEKVFEPFQRIHKHDDVGGTGLGLGICKQIVSCHDGDIYIESSSDTGTTVVIRLPAHEEVFQRAA